MFQYRMKIRFAILQIPTERHRRMFFVEEIAYGRFVQTKINEFTDSSVRNQSETKIFRKIKSS